MERTPRRRRRPARSCLECRRRKIKCDRNEPCVHCTSAATQCVYNTYGDRPASHQPFSTPISIVTPLPASTQTQQNHTNIVPSENETCIVSAEQDNGFLVTPDCTNTHVDSLAQNAESDLKNILSRIETLEKSLKSYSASTATSINENILSSQPGLQEAHVILNKTRLLRWSLWLSTAEEFAPIISCYAKAGGKFAYTKSSKGGVHATDKESSLPEAEVDPLVLQIHDLLLESKNIARIYKAGRPSRSISYLEFVLEPPTRELADTLIALYFESFESTHRILHIPTFWNEYQKFWDNREISTGQRLKMLLVIGIGSCLDDEKASNPGLRDMVRQWVYAAQNWLSGPLEKDRLDITGLQVHCLAILAREMLSIGGDLIWISVGSLIHKAMQVGLHRDPIYLPGMNRLQAELRRRLWATILEITVQSSLDSAMPPRISLSEFDTKPPSNFNDDELEDSTLVDQPWSKNCYTATSIQIMLLDSLPIRLRILQLLNSLHTEVSYLEVLSLSADIMKKRGAGGAFLKEKKDSGVTQFHRNLHDFLVYRFLMPLHCQFAIKARTNLLFQYSIKASLDAAMATLLFEPDDRFTRLISNGGGMFKEGVRLAGTLIGLELIAQTETQCLEGALHRNTLGRQTLKQPIKQLILWSIERIREGDTNIKDHMFLSMILAHVEAIELGTSPELSIAQAAKDSLQFCCGLLRAQAGDIYLQPLEVTEGLVTVDDQIQNEYGLDFDLDFFFPDAGFN
ncbi:hypothetical protein PVAG01_11473 [Phlyctema vagabunda]|uniref:Zn(2)-C6 fungal-type domain-containing protein n=1 Tax=Phlyctema vagabunda TaxID=108571 RepID=A0ABR4P2D9_9HELO